MKIGILGALAEEIFPVTSDSDSIQIIAEKQFKLLFYLKHELFLAQSGVGKVNAALTATLLIQHFKCEFIFCVGTSGGLDPMLQVGDILIADQLYQHDYGSLIDGFFHPSRSGSHPAGKRKFLKPFCIKKYLKQQIQELHLDVHWGTLISGDLFVKGTRNGEAVFQQFNAQALDMESAAVAQVAECFHCPYVALRCISDLVGVSQKRPVSIPHSAMTRLHRILTQMMNLKISPHS